MYIGKNLTSVETDDNHNIAAFADSNSANMVTGVDDVQNGRKNEEINENQNDYMDVDDDDDNSTVFDDSNDGESSDEQDCDGFELDDEESLLRQAKKIAEANLLKIISCILAIDTKIAADYCSNNYTSDLIGLQDLNHQLDTADELMSVVIINDGLQDYLKYFRNIAKDNNVHLQLEKFES